MKDVLQFLYEYRRLLSRLDLFGAAFEPHARDRLAALHRLFAPDSADLPGPARRRHARCDVRVPAIVKAGGRVEPVEIINVGGGGLCAQPAPSLQAGERAVVRIVSAENFREYHYPVQAQWVRRVRGTSMMGMPFVGAPLQVTANL
jgi:hypothetical protein